MLAPGVLPGKPNKGLAASVVGAADAAGAAPEFAGVDVGVLPKRLPVAAGFAPKRDVVGVEVPENNEPAFGAVESPVFRAPNKPPAGAFAACPLSAGGGPAGVVEKPNVLVGAGVVDPDAAVDAGVPKLSPPAPGGLFSPPPNAPPWLPFCPKLSPPPKEGVEAFAVPKRPPEAVEELGVVAVFPPNKLPLGVFPVPLLSAKVGVFAGVALGVELEVPNMDVCWLPPAVRPPNKFFGACDVDVAGWPNSEGLGVEVEPSVLLGAPWEVFEAAANGLDAPLPEAEPKLNAI